VQDRAQAERDAATALAARPDPVVVAPDDPPSPWLPELRGHVNDYASLLTKPQALTLEQKLAAFERAWGHRFSLLVVRGLRGGNISSFARDMSSRAGLDRGSNPGGLLLIFDEEDQEIRLQVGPALDAKISNDVGAKIINEQLIPDLKAGRYAKGVNSTFDRLIAAAVR
jgi:uncharacterized protein